MCYMYPLKNNRITDVYDNGNIIPCRKQENYLFSIKLLQSIVFVAYTFLPAARFHT